VPDLEAAFSAVVADPEADEPREAYANAVRRTDPAHTEFIECMLATHAAYLRREDAGPEIGTAELIRRNHGTRLAGRITQFISGYAFGRGFVETIAVDAEWFLESGEDLYAMAPVLHLNLTDVKPAMEDVFASPLLDRIHSISLLREELGDEEAAIIAASPHLGNLRWLELGLNQIGAPGLEALAASTGLPKLQWLGFSVNAVEDPTPRFADEYDYPSAVGRQLQERYGPKDWLDARPRWKWPPEREHV
jgi:hypothetical protein